MSLPTDPEELKKLKEWLEEKYKANPVTNEELQELLIKAIEANRAVAMGMNHVLRGGTIPDENTKLVANHWMGEMDRWGAQWIHLWREDFK